MNQHLNQEGEANYVLLEVKETVVGTNGKVVEVKDAVVEAKEKVVEVKLTLEEVKGMIGDLLAKQATAPESESESESESLNTTLGALKDLLQNLVNQNGDQDGPPSKRTRLVRYLPVRFEYRRGHEDDVVRYAGSHYTDVNALLRSPIATIDNGVLMLDSESAEYGEMKTAEQKGGKLATTVSIINRILFAMMNNKIAKYYPKQNSKKVFVYRITKDLPDDMIASLKVGELFMDKSFMSTSKKEGLWKEQSGFKYLFKIECLGGGNGFNIQGLVQPHKQYGAEEAEVLFLPRTYFEITKVEATHDENYGDITERK